MIITEINVLEINHLELDEKPTSSVNESERDLQNEIKNNQNKMVTISIYHKKGKKNFTLKIQFLIDFYPFTRAVI